MFRKGIEGITKDALKEIENGHIHTSERDRPGETYVKVNKGYRVYFEHYGPRHIPPQITGIYKKESCGERFSRRTRRFIHNLKYMKTSHALLLASATISVFSMFYLMGPPSHKEKLLSLLLPGRVEYNDGSIVMKGVRTRSSNGTKEECDIIWNPGEWLTYQKGGLQIEREGVGKPWDMSWGERGNFYLGTHDRGTIEGQMTRDGVKYNQSQGANRQIQGEEITSKDKKIEIKDY
ncbi:MAG: hypothetical protein Q7J54_07590 [Candidatus Woesearchaeota archaeon]|nr:hypothetical protein [Candidatus Woesearchaeota archaeon]